MVKGGLYILPFRAVAIGHCDTGFELSSGWTRMVDDSLGYSGHSLVNMAKDKETQENR